MATTIFPQNSPTAADETEFQDRALAQNLFPRVLQTAANEHFELDSISGLDVTIDEGIGVVGGVRIQVSSPVTVTLPSSATRVLGLELTRSSGLVQTPTNDEDNYTLATSSGLLTDAKDFLPLYVFVTGGSGVTSIRDVRWMTPGSVMTRMLLNTETRTSTTTLSESDRLRVPLLHSGLIGDSADLLNYFRIVAEFSSNGGGVKLELVSPEYAVGGDLDFGFRVYSPTGLINQNFAAAEGVTYDITHATASLTHWVIEGRAYMNNPGELIVSWAQESSNGGDTTLSASGSYAQNTLAVSENVLPLSEL